MNERLANNKIYLLAKEAGLIEFEQLDWNPELVSPTYESVAKSRKFAELIVRECVKILSQNNPCPPGTTIMYSLLQDEYFDKGWQVAVETKSNQIKRHFGVEE